MKNCGGLAKKISPAKQILQQRPKRQASAIAFSGYAQFPPPKDKMGQQRSTTFESLL